MLRFSALMIATSLFTGCMVGDTDGQSNEDIIGGTLDYGDPSIGFLRVVTGLDAATGRGTSLSGCTATLIAPQVMLTAAHCNVNGLWTDVSFAAQPDIFAPAGAAGFHFASIISDPRYDGNGKDGHDLAVVILDEPLSLTPVRRGPVPFVGATVRAVGYGMNVFGSDGTGIGTKRQVTLPVESVEVGQFTAGYQGRNVCHGDSGGPVLQGGRIVGNSDWVDQTDCEGSGHFMTYDADLDFIQTYAPGF